MTPAQISAAVALEALKADLKDEINFDINTRLNKVPESVVDQVIDLLAARNLLALAALPPSSGQSPSQSELNSAKEEAKDEAADFILSQLARALGLETFTPADGSETWDGDVSGTVWAILRDAGVIDPETNKRVASSGWEAGAEAMREAAARTAENAHLVEPDGGSPTEDEAAVASEAARRIRALPLPPPPSSEGA